MPAAGKGFGAVFCQLLALSIDRCVGNAQLAGHLRNRFPTGLSQLHRFTLKLGCIGLLRFLYDPCPPSERVYPKLSLFHKVGAGSPGRSAIF